MQSTYSLAKYQNPFWIKLEDSFWPIRDISQNILSSHCGSSNDSNPYSCTNCTNGSLRSSSVNSIPSSSKDLCLEGFCGLEKKMDHYETTFLIEEYKRKTNSTYSVELIFKTLGVSVAMNNPKGTKVVSIRKTFFHVLPLFWCGST